MAQASSVAAVRLGFAALVLSVALAPLSMIADRASAQPAAAAPAAAGDPVAGKMVFENANCGTCHTLKDAGSTGPVGPVLDGDSNLSTSLVVSRVTNGQGSMPPFGDQLSPKEIADVSAYVMKAAAK